MWSRQCGATQPSLCSSAVPCRGQSALRHSRRSCAVRASSSACLHGREPSAAAAVLQASSAGDWSTPQLCSLRARPSAVRCQAMLGGQEDIEQDDQQPEQVNAGLGRGSTVEFRDGPRNLDQEAPAFVQTEQPEGFRMFDDSPSTEDYITYPFFFDPSGAVEREMVRWLDGCEMQMSSPPKAPLYINGLTKSGKSAALDALLPAVIRNHPTFGVGRPKELLVFRLDMSDLNTKQGYSSMLQQFLNVLQLWCAKVGVTLDKKLGADVIEACKPGAIVSDTELQILIVDLLRGIKTPTIMLIDELQMWFCPLQPGTNVEDPGSWAREFWKRMIYKSGNNILWAATGSGMAMVYANLNLIPTAGTSALASYHKVSLPAAYSDADLLHFADQLLNYLPPQRLPTASELVEGSGKSVAVMAAAAFDWRAGMAAAEFPAYANQYIVNKLLPESIADWSRTLPLLTPKDRKILLGLSDSTMGVEMDALAIGMAHHLTDYVEDVDGVPGHKRLASRLHRLVTKIAITDDGDLRASVADYLFTSDLGFAEEYLVLQRFANLVSNGLAQGFSDTYEPLKALLQGWADRLRATHRDYHIWHQLPWFQAVLHSEYNNFGRKPTADQSLKGVETMSEVEVLAWYHRMVQNCLTHSRTAPEKDSSVASVLNITQDDISIVREWPFASGVSLKEALVNQLQSLEISIRSMGGSSAGPDSGTSASTSSTGHDKGPKPHGSYKKGSSGRGGRGPRTVRGRARAGKARVQAVEEIEYGGPYGAMLMRIGWPGRAR